MEKWWCVFIQNISDQLKLNFYWGIVRKHTMNWVGFQSIPLQKHFVKWFSAIIKHIIIKKNAKFCMFISFSIPYSLELFLNTLLSTCRIVFEASDFHLAKRGSVVVAIECVEKFQDLFLQFYHIVSFLILVVLVVYVYDSF